MHAQRLRASGQGDHIDVDLGRLETTGTGIPDEDVLGGLVDAIHSRTDAATAYRRVADRIDEATAVDATGVIAAFCGYNRVADATGCDLGAHADLAADVVAELELDRFRHDG